MKDIIELHRSAMDYAERAELAKRSGQSDNYVELAEKALQLEMQAARRIADDTTFEPTRSILFRSAAALALDLGRVRDAEKLIAAALSGDPPAGIAEELRDLLEDVYFHRHLQVRGIKLAEDELQMVLEGAAIGHGITRSDAFIRRVRDLESLVYRTAERLMGKEFRDAGRRKKVLAERLELYLSAPRAASFAVTLKLGQSSQLSLPGVDYVAATISEVMDNLAFVNTGDLIALEERIPDESYRRNFIALAESLSPDGDDVNMVGFTGVNKQGERTVTLTIPRRKLRKKVRQEADQAMERSQRQRVEFSGVLLEADATSQKAGVIEVVDRDGKKHRVYVPRGMMSDIVKPMFEEDVYVTGIVQDGKVDLVTIDLLEDVSVDRE